jgi:hypothetical protein
MPRKVRPPSGSRKHFVVPGVVFQTTATVLRRNEHAPDLWINIADGGPSRALDDVSRGRAEKSTDYLLRIVTQALSAFLIANDMQACQVIASNSLAKT